MSANSTVSVILPVDKPGPWLEQCLDSIPGDVELIRVDGVSGAARARNIGLDRATGEYVMFVDSDDYLSPGAVWRMVEAIGDEDLVVGSFRKFGSFEMTVTHPTQILSEWQVAMYVMGNLKNPRQNQMLSGCWGKLFRRSLMGRFPEITTAEDMAFNFDYLTRCKNVQFISDVVYHNRKREGSLSTTFDPKDKWGLFGFLEGLKYLKKFLLKHYSHDEIDKALDNSKVYHSMLYFMRIVNQEGGSMNDAFKKLYP